MNMSDQQPQQEQQQQRPPASKLQTVNYANILAYLVNVGVTYGVGVSGYFPTNAELSEKYQTLVTPAGYAFSIWGVIFISQFIWVILQALPAFRSSDLVIKGVGFWYVAVCVAQCAWSIFFAQEWIEASLGAMLSILLALVMIVSKQESVNASWKQYWGFQFPFEIHCGWIWAASVVNSNVVVVAREVAADTQTIVTWSSFGLLALVAFYYLWGKKNYVVPIVLAWATFGIYVELQQPKDSIVAGFEASTIELVQRIALVLASVVLGLTVLLGGYDLWSQRRNRGASNNASNYSSMP